jgi:ribosome biogenesis GTPase
MNLFKGRIISQYKDLYKIAMTNEELTGEVSGKFRFSATSPASFPAVGDYVMVDRESDSAGNGIIHELLPRKSLLARKAAGNEKITQIIAANIDYIFICMSLNNDFNLRRIERYLAIAWDSGAVPLIVLTKADLADNLSEKLQEVEEIAPGVDVIITSMENDNDHLQVFKYIKEGKTGAFVGSSGVGKSTLINKVLGKDVIKTSEIRSDDKGRHTTTRRDLFILPNGGAVIDTPGMRELGIDQADLSRSFEDIEALATECRFKDCSHKSEPGCALRKGIEDGTISEERLESYLKLKKEAGYEGLNSKEIEKKKIESMFAEFGGIKNARNFVKRKSKP